MAIIKNGAALKAYKGAYKPVNLYRGADKIAGWDWQEQTGEALEWDGTYDDTVELLSVTGKSTQTVTATGKNKFDETRATMDAIINTSGVLVITAGFYATDFIPCVAGTRYYANRPNTASVVAFYWPDRTFLSYTSDANPFIAPVNAGYFRTYSKTSDISIDAYQIEIGSSFTGYAPFVPNCPSPNYPSPVYSAGGEVVSQGKNLINITKFQAVYANSEATLIDYATIRYVGIYHMSLPINLEPGIYTLKFDAVVNSGAANICWSIAYDGGGRTALKFNGNSVTITDRGTRLDVWNNNMNYGTVDVIYSNIQLEMGATATPYVPYFVPEQITLPMLRSLPNGITDTLADGVCIRNIGEFIVTGTEAWTWAANYTSSTRFYVLYAGNSTIQSNATVNLRSTHFVGASFNTMQTTPNNVHVHNGDTRIGVVVDNVFLGILDGDDSATRVSKLKSWFAAQYAAGTPVTVLYQLATPVTTQITPGKLKTYPYHTDLMQTGAVKAGITAWAKVSV